MIGVLCPPEFDGDLYSKLSFIYHHRCEDDDEREGGVRHQEGENGNDVVLPSLLPDEGEDDGEQLKVNPIK